MKIKAEIYISTRSYKPRQFIALVYMGKYLLIITRILNKASIGCRYFIIWNR
jgi:hypothetical protein